MDLLGERPEKSSEGSKQRSSWQKQHPFSTTNIKNPSKKPVLKLFTFLLKACFALNLKSLVIFKIVYFEIFFPSLPCDDITSSH